MTLFALLIICFFPSPFFAHPLTSEQALQAVLGTSDPDELKRIARNPSAYWEERKAHLLKEGTLKPHRSFMEDFIQETKQRCQDLLKQTKESLWFRDFTLVDEVLDDLLSANDPMYLLGKARAYTMLCDNLLQYNRLQVFPDKCDSKEIFRKEIRGYVALRDRAHFRQLYKKMFWLVSASGLFSMWDCLVMIGENLALGGMQKNVMDRDRFSTHCGAFRYHRGALEHDTTHASSIISMLEAFNVYGVSCGSYVQDCLKEKTTSTGNVVELCQKVLAGFFKFHEVPPYFCPGIDLSLKDLLFPEKVRILSDGGMREVTRFFLDTQADVSQGPLTPQELSHDDTLKHLYTWSDSHFSKVSQRYLKPLSSPRTGPRGFWRNCRCLKPSTK